MLFSTYNIHYGVGADGKYDVAAHRRRRRPGRHHLPPGNRARLAAERLCRPDGRDRSAVEPLLSASTGRWRPTRAPSRPTAGSPTGGAASATPSSRAGRSVVARRDAAEDAADATGFDLQRGYIEAAIDGTAGPLTGLLHAFEPRRPGAAPAAGRGADGRSEACSHDGRHLGRHGARQLHVPGARACRAGLGDRGRRFQFHAGAGGVSAR